MRARSSLRATAALRATNHKKGTARRRRATVAFPRDEQKRTNAARVARDDGRSVGRLGLDGRCACVCVWLVTSVVPSLTW